MEMRNVEQWWKLNQTDEHSGLQKCARSAVLGSAHDSAKQKGPPATAAYLTLSTLCRWVSSLLAEEPAKHAAAALGCHVTGVPRRPGWARWHRRGCRGRQQGPFPWARRHRRQRSLAAGCVSSAGALALAAKGCEAAFWRGPAAGGAGPQRCGLCGCRRCSCGGV